jgi:hypothetical protein
LFIYEDTGFARKMAAVGMVIENTFELPAEILDIARGPLIVLTGVTDKKVILTVGNCKFHFSTFFYPHCATG